MLTILFLRHYFAESVNYLLNFHFLLVYYKF